MKEKFYRLLQIISRLKINQKIILAAIFFLVIVSVGAGVVVTTTNKREKSLKEKESLTEIEVGVPKEQEEMEEDDPQNAIVEDQKEADGADVNIKDVLEGYTDEITNGIDVSIWQGVIDWEKVAKSGVDFAMVRVGFRSLDKGIMKADENAKYNMQQAAKYGIKVGVYFFSTAISEAEALEEANWVADYISQYQITYPVAYDCEGYNTPENRQYGMTIAKRTDIALTFMNRIKERGYSAMFYASKSDMEDEPTWDVNRISSLYSIWIAQYPTSPYPQTPMSEYSGSHVMWQYTNKGTVPGIKGYVDMNVAYFGSTSSETPKDPTVLEEVKPNVEATMVFVDVNESVTAWEKTNLRTSPSQADDSNIAQTLLNGEVATRTGICESSGWSRVVFEGQTYYAVTSLLTTDVNYKPPVDDGIKTQFEERNELVTPIEAVNLRTKPTTIDEIGPVVVQIKKGDVVTRTGINEAVGFSRVVWNGQTLYCVSSYLDVCAQIRGSSFENQGK